jgi:hypothetical protein
MKTLHTAVAATASALALLAGAPASAAVVYNLSDYQAAFSPPLGTVSVSGQGGQTLTFDVHLGDNVYFQQLGSGAAKDAFWFDLTGVVGVGGVTGAVNYNVTTPDGAASGTGDFPTGGLFTGAAYSSSASYGQGFLMGANYEIKVSDSSKPINYYHGDLIFTVTGGAGSHLDLGPISGNNVFAGADLRECSDITCTTVLATGPVGAVVGGTTQLTGGVPEPASWALMIIGFGGVGASLRRRRQTLALAAA